MSWGHNKIKGGGECNDRIEQGGYNFYNSHYMAPNFRWQGHMTTQS